MTHIFAKGMFLAMSRNRRDVGTITWGYVKSLIHIKIMANSDLLSIIVQEIGEMWCDYPCGCGGRQRSDPCDYP